MVTQKMTLWERVSNVFRFKESGGDDAPVFMQTKPIGSFGTRSYAGYASEEYLTTLRGKERADVFDQMRRSDPQVKMCLSSVKNPIKGAVWEVEPANETDEAKADAELIDHILFKDMDQPWIDFVGEALTMVDFGHAVFEPIHKSVMNHKKFGSYHGIKVLAFRSQRTIECWNLDQTTGALISVTQHAYGDLDRMVDIPARNVLVFSVDKEGANYEGISMLRPCYGPWFRKNNYLKLNAVGIEKFAIPTPLVKVPENKQNTAQYTNMINALESYTTHQTGYLTFPFGWEVSLNSNTYDPQKVETSIDNEDKRMVKAFLANFLELGMNTTGSYAMSNNLSDFFLSGLDHLAGKISDQFNRHVIPQLIMMNRGQRDEYPILKHSGVSDKAGRELAELLKYLGDSRFITPDDQTEEHLRKRYKLPKSSLEGRRLPQEPGLVAPAAPPQQLAERIRLAEAKRKRLLDVDQ